MRGDHVVQPIFPRSVDFSPDSNFAYVANEGDGNVEVVDLSTFSVVAGIHEGVSTISENENRAYVATLQQRFYDQEIWDELPTVTNYWIAKIFPQDQWHARVIEVEYEIGVVNLITTETVLVETLNYFSEYRRDVKGTAFLIVKSILESDEVAVIEQTNEIFLTEVEYYETPR